MAAVSSRIDEFGDAVVAVVTFGDQHSVAEYVERTQLSIPILIDIDRAGYRAFGCGRGSVRRVWGWRAGLRYLQILRRRGMNALQTPNEDSLQLGGDFVIDSAGVLTYAFWGAGPDERPSVDDLLTAVYGPAPTPT